MRPFNKSQIPVLDCNKYSQFKNINSGLILDIGSGTGLSSLQLAKEYPKNIVIGIERTKEKFRIFKNHANEAKLANLYPINEDAIPFVTQFIADKSLCQIHILYPNPYPKEKQSNKRFHNMPFMSELIKKMEPGCTITQATNIKSYHEEAVAAFVNQWGFKSLKEYKVDSGSKRTNFEIKYLARDETCYGIEMQV